MKMLKGLLCLLGAVGGATARAVLEADRSCYHTGMMFSQMKDPHGKNGNINEVIDDFCTNIVLDVFERGQRVEHCYPFPPDNSKHRVEMDITSVAMTKQAMTVEECTWTMKWLYNHCWCGGQDDYNGFHFRIDPNAGRC